MALITCPHCGKQVSDTVERCIHCGALIKEQPPEPKRYVDLSREEKDSLDAKFEREHPEYSIRKAERKKKIQSAIYFILGVVCIIGAVLVLVNGSLRLDRFCEKNGIHLQGTYDSSELTEEEIEYYCDELETDAISCVQQENGIVIITSNDMERLQIRLVGDVLISILLIIVWLILGVVNIVKYMKADRQILLRLKLFQAWLAKIDIQYDLKFSDGRKKKFDSINISKYQL